MDVVKGAGSSVGPDVQIFQSTFKAGDMLSASCSPQNGQCMDGRKVAANGSFVLVMAGTHCHAPNCMRQDLINLDTNETLCSSIPVHGQTEDVFHEQGYISTPPCTWGSAKEGFLPPPVLYRNTTLQMLTYYNSTWGHPGQMGIWQV